MDKVLSSAFSAASQIVSTEQERLEKLETSHFPSRSSWRRRNRPPSFVEPGSAPVAIVPQFVGVSGGNSGKKSPAEPMANSFLKFGNVPPSTKCCTWHNCNPSIPTKITRLTLLDVFFSPFSFSKNICKVSIPSICINSSPVEAT